VAEPVAAAARAFEALGASVEEVKPGFADTTDMIRLVWGAHYIGNYGQFLDQWRDRMDPGLVACMDEAKRWSAAEYVAMRGRKIALWDSVRPLFERYDLLLTPTTSVAAFEVGRLNPAGWPQHAWDWFPWASFSYPFNFTGQPAATVPAGFTPAGLPVGLQIVGRRFADLTVLQAARAFERGDAGGGHGGRGRAFMTSRRRRSSAGLGERAADDSTAPRPSPLWGMGGPSEPSPERVTATGEPCRRARDPRARPRRHRASREETDDA
jgi:aspartyl-tRNA(Asn)/glutamyl-tRNA(Gln) amidotransferase subunit A